jgi:hypothetical protein
MPISTLVILIALLTTAPVSVGAFDFTFPWIDREASFEITETLVLDYHDDNLDYGEFGPNPYNDDYGDIRNRLNLKLTVEEFSFSARVDTTTFIQAPKDPGVKIKYLDRYAPEKLTASYHGRNLQVDLGDFYASFGRAIALRIRKTDELSEDTTLLGAKIRAQLGPVDITGLGGLSNPSNWDGVTEKTLKDPYDLISGLSVAVRPMESLVLRAHGVGVIIDPLEQNQRAQGLIEGAFLPEYALVFGGAIEVIELAELADLYAEFNWMEKELKLPDLPAADGWAAYFGGNLYMGDLTLTAEFKSYSDYELFSETDSASGKYKPERLHYIRPPTLEPEDMDVTNNHDVTGARLKIDWRPWGGDTVLFASYAGFVADDPTFQNQPDKSRWIYNLQVGMEQFFLKRGRAKVDVGLREEVPDWAGGDRHHLFYLDADVKVPIGARHSLSAQGFNWWAHTMEAPSAYDYLRGEWTLAYSWSPHLTVGVILGYDTKFSQSRDLEIITDFAGYPVRQVFFAGSLTVNLSSRVVFNLLTGQIRGGPKCVSGACRVFPPFAGVRLETVIRL